MEMTREKYDQIKAMNQSALKQITNSTPAAVEHYKTNPPGYGRPAYIGIAAHAATFEPEDFLRTYITAPDWEGRPRNKTTKNGGCKEEWDAWKLENQDKEILSHDEYHGAILGMLGAMEKHPAASAILSNGVAERSFEEEINGVLCKGRLDWIFPETNLSVISENPSGESYCDLKTTSKNFSPTEIDRFLFQNQIHFQAAFYHELFLRATGKTFHRHIILMVSSEPPYLCQPYQISSAAMKKGRMEVMESLSKWKNWNETPQEVRPVGFSNGILNADIPAWAV